MDSEPVDSDHPHPPASPSTAPAVSKSKHDWHSPNYVESWIAADITRDNERRPLIRQMLAHAPFPPAQAVHVLDVGGGYGVVTEEVLRALPRAQVTLQDYSPAMLDRARQRLERFGSQVSYLRSDLRDPSWTARLPGPFDLAVSALVLHNLADLRLIGDSYRAVFQLLKPGAAFLDYDLFDLLGGPATQQQALCAAGFERAECLWYQPPLAIIAAFRP